MLACRVCLEGGFSDDPEAWLDTVTERQLLTWQAYYRIEPFGGQFHRSAETNSLLSGILSLIAASHGQKLPPAKFKDFMPSNWIEPKKSKQRIKANPRSIIRTEKQFAAAVPTWKQRRIK